MCLWLFLLGFQLLMKWLCPSLHYAIVLAFIMRLSTTFLNESSDPGSTLLTLGTHQIGRSVYTPVK